jgi:hypothetical protein
MRRFGVYVITERRCNSSKTVEHERTLEQLIRELLVPMVKKTNSIYVGWWRTRPLDPKKVTNLNRLPWEIEHPHEKRLISDDM